MAQQTVNSNVTETYVEAVIEESFLSKIDVGSPASCGTHQSIECPTNQEFLDWALANPDKSNARPLSQREFWEVINVQHENDAWSAQLSQWNEEPITVTIRLQIPISELPNNFSNEDIISWGRNHSQLRQESDIY